jgi:HEAT repeat protein
LMRLGARATPFVIVRTNDIDPIIRSWATRLLGELPSVESSGAVVRRLADSDPDVRRAALAAARLLQNNADARTAIRDELLELATQTTRPNEARHMALEALADLREPRSISRLIRLLGDGATEIAKSAHWALVVITRQDFGRDAERWNEWWAENSEKHRIEWLIDALMHDLADIRRAAGDELKSLTKEYFGYYDDLPKKERARAQQRYREWWESKGKARFP